MYHTTLFWGFQDPISSLSHLFGAVVFLILGGKLVYRARGNSWRILSVCIYTFSIVFLLSMSGVYHLLEIGSTARNVLQRLDHAGIWLLIAGSFTPFHTILFWGFWRWSILMLVWTVAITGLTLEVVFFHDFPEWLSLTFYLSLGWLGLLSGWAYTKFHPKGPLSNMVIGGLCYSIGAILDFIKWPIIINGWLAYHEIFHIFVLAGIASHWLFMMKIATLGMAQKLTLKVKVRENQTMRYFAKAQSENIQIFAATKSELNSKIHQQVNQVYRKYRCPEAIRLQFCQEDFIDPRDPGARLVTADSFHS